MGKKSKPLGAEAAYQLIANDPKFQAGLKRAKDKLAAFAEVYFATLPILEKEWQDNYSEPCPKGLDDWMHLAARAGFSGDFIMSDKWTPAKIEPIITGYLRGVCERKEPELLTRPLSKADASRALNGGGVSNPTDFIDRRIRNGTLTRGVGSGRYLQYLVSEFPESERKNIS